MALIKRSSVVLFIYSLIWYVLLPIVLLYLARRMFKSSDYRQGFWQRLGYVPKRYAGCLHIHCASLGEVNAAKNLINQLILAYPHLPIVVTNSTPTGAAQVKRLFADAIQSNRLIQLMAPLDTWGAVHRFSRRLNPKYCLFTEVEIWPNWLHALKKRGATLLLVNARLSERSAKKYHQLASLFKAAINRFDWIGCQSKAVQARYLSLSAKQVEVTGNLKFDLQLSQALPEQINQLQQTHQLNRPIWIAASVHPDEYQQVIAAHQRILKVQPTCLLIIVPRHPEQFAAVAEYLSAQGHSFITRSSQAQLKNEHSIWLIDTLGELMCFYALADIAFVGGSLIDRGGHNPLEPAALAKPVIMGPYQDNCLEICQALNQKSALVTVENADRLHQALMQLWQKPALYQQAAVGANDVVMENQGAVNKTLTHVAQFIQ